MFLKKSLKKYLNIYFLISYYFIMVYVKILAKNVIFKKNKSIYKSFYCLKASVTMFNECFCFFFTHWTNFKLIHMFT